MEEQDYEKEIEIEDEASDDASPSSMFSISSYGADYTVDGLVKRMKTGAFFVPPFQRSFVWNQVQASRFIESLLMGLPVPGIFVFKEANTGKHLIIDGQQRLTTLQYFYENRFRDKLFQLKEVREPWNGKSYLELSPEDQRRLDDSIVHTTIFQQDAPNNDRSIYEVFERINTGGIKLSAQEIRACVSYGKFQGMLVELNDDVNWREIYGPKSPRMKDQELILRFLAFAFRRKEYARPFRAFLDKFLSDQRELTSEQYDLYSKAFTRTIKLVRACLGPKAFRPVRSFNVAVFDACMVGMYERLKTSTASNKILAARVAAAYEKLNDSEAFIEATRGSTADEGSVRKRIELAIGAFKDA